jgi:hypothetical protein
MACIDCTLQCLVMDTALLSTEGGCATVLPDGAPYVHACMRCSHFIAPYLMFAA